MTSLPEDGVAIVKATPIEQEALITQDPATYSPAPRVGRYGWVRVQVQVQVQVHSVLADDLCDLVTQA